eukprot:GHVU01124458.1.p1 GENE.GHVU01124458.1~~GHVU01124458.1.p1  ORF type:complete len:120 (+),score=4.27 GHVU01124458.1:314-673(+)
MINSEGSSMRAAATHPAKRPPTCWGACRNPPPAAAAAAATVTHQRHLRGPPSPATVLLGHTGAHTHPLTHSLHRWINRTDPFRCRRLPATRMHAATASPPPSACLSDKPSQPSLPTTLT